MQSTPHSLQETSAQLSDSVIASEAKQFLLKPRLLRRLRLLAMTAHSIFLPYNQFAIRNRQRGLSLPELLVALAMLGILAGVASLQTSPLLVRARLDRGARQLATDLQLVRMKAIAQNTRFRVTFQTDTPAYIIERETADDWQRHLLHSHVVGAVDDASVTLPPGVTITAANSAGDVVFVPRGHVDGGITVTLGATGAEANRRIIVNLAGRVRIE